MTLGVCLVGSGNMARIRVRSMQLIEDISLEAIVSKSGGKNLPFKKETPIFSDLTLFGKSEILKKVSAVIVTTRTSDHYQNLIDIFNIWSKDEVFVFIEKPVASSDEDIAELIKKCPPHIKICCSFQRRFDPSYVALKEAIGSGKIGDPNYCRVFFADHPVPPIDFLLKEGCPFMDLTPHDVDFVRWCLQDEVESVSALGSSTIKELKEHGVLDNIVVTLKFKKGCIVQIYCSRSCSYGYDQRCEFFSKEGRLEVDNSSRDSFKAFTNNGQTSSLLEHSYPQRFEKGFQIELETFFKVCKKEVEWPITYKDCIAVQQIAMAAAEACKKGTTVKL